MDSCISYMFGFFVVCIVVAVCVSCPALLVLAVLIVLGVATGEVIKGEAPK